MIEQGAKRSLRMVHMTDCHVYNDAKVIASMEKICSDIQSMVDKPSLIVNTGDSIFDANFKSKKLVEEDWNVWKKVSALLDIPLHSVLGNHDVFYPAAFNFLSNIYSPFRDKNIAKQMLNMPSDYYSFTNNGWKFIALNSIDKRYALNDAQFNWLTNELVGSTDPVCIFSHVPILSIASFMYHLDKKRWWAFPKKEMQHDSFKLQALFSRHKNVKLCLSGHVHYTDDVVYNGVRYLCGGAVCGNWWKQLTERFPPQYTILDLYEDGTIEKEIIHY